MSVILAASLVSLKAEKTSHRTLSLLKKTPNLRTKSHTFNMVLDDRVRLNLCLPEKDFQTLPKSALSAALPQTVLLHRERWK